MNHTLHETTLPSGIRLLIIDIPGTTHSDLSISFNAGYRFATNDAHVASIETPHILEHSVFDGSAAYPSSDALQDIFTQGDGQWNGFTSAYHVAYAFRNKQRYLLSILEAALDMVYFPLLTETSFDEEVAVAANEHADAMNNLLGAAALTTQHQLMPDFIMRSDTLLRALQATSHEEVKKYHKKYYTLKNTTIVITCDLQKVTKKDIIKSITDKTLTAPSGKYHPLPTLPITPGGAPSTFEKIGRSIGTTYASLGFFSDQTPSTPDTVMALLFTRMVTNMKSYSVQHRLRKQGMAYSMSFTPSGSLETRGFELEIEAKNSQFKTLTTQTLTMIKEMSETGISDDHFKSLKQELIESYEDELEPGDIIGWYLYEFLMTGTLPTQAEYKTALETIQQEDVLRYAQTLITKETLYSTVFSRKPIRDSVTLDTLSTSVFSNVPAESMKSVFNKEMDKYYIRTPESTRYERMYIYINQRPWLAWLYMLISLGLGLALVVMSIVSQEGNLWMVRLLMGVFILTGSITSIIAHVTRKK